MSRTNPNATCINCDHFSPTLSDDGYGFCRCKAPRAKMIVPASINPEESYKEPERFALWPLVHKTEWCGECKMTE